MDCARPEVAVRKCEDLRCQSIARTLIRQISQRLKCQQQPPGRRPGDPRRVSRFPERQGFVVRIECMKYCQPAFKSLHKVAILAAYRHDTPFSPRFCTYTEHFDELVNLGPATGAALTAARTRQ